MSIWCSPDTRRAAGDCHRQAGQLSGRSPRAFAVGDPSPLEVPQQPGRELPSVDQGPGAGDETLRLAWAGPTVPVCVRQHPTALSAPSSSDQRARMANRDDQPLRGLEPDHYRRSGLKDAVSHHLSPASPLTSTALQAFPNSLTMPFVELAPFDGNGLVAVLWANTQHRGQERSCFGIYCQRTDLRVE